MRDERDELLSIAREVVRRARERVEVAEATIGSSWDLSAKVRLGETELVEEAGQRGISLRVLSEGRLAMTSTSDLSPAGLELLIRDAVELTALAEPDPWMGPADPSELARPPFEDLDLFDPRVDEIDADEAIARALEAERAALESDSRIELSEGATFSRTSSTRAMVLSSGFEGVQRGSYASLSVVPVVLDDGDKRRRGFYWTAKRHLDELESGPVVGREAARRTLQKLGSKKVKTGEFPILFDADSARSILGTFASVVVGGAIWRKSSYLLSRLNTEVASANVDIVDDPLLRRAPGSRAFDGEGLPSRRNVVVRAGRLETFLLDCYSARKLGARSTASASRSGGAIGPSTTNFVMQAGETSPEAMVAQTERGLLVTEMMGFGFNAVTGDFSRGAGGFWIEDGRIAHPVSEVTISSNLDAMLRGIDLVGSDLELKTSTAAPSFRVRGMTISGD